MNTYKQRQEAFHVELRDIAKNEARNLIQLRAEIGMNIDHLKGMWPEGSYEKYEKAMRKMAEAVRLLQSI